MTKHQPEKMTERELVIYTRNIERVQEALPTVAKCKKDVEVAREEIKQRQRQKGH